MPDASRIHVILNVTHGCNLACSYCYYREEMAAKPGQMDLSTVEKVFERAASSSAGTFDFSIHGGEPLLRKPSFYTELFRLQRQYLSGKTVTNAIQTNGTLIDETFIATYKAIRESGAHLGLGISLDGPQPVHDAVRRFRAGSRGSFADVIASLDLLAEHGIEVALLAVAPISMPEYAPLLYGFFRSLPNVHFLDLLVPRYDSFEEGQEGGLGEIFTRVFDDWFRDERAVFDIRFFCSVVLALLTGSGTLCTFQKDCIRDNRMLSIRPNGDVSFCDSYPDEVLGNVANDELDRLVDANHKLRRRLSMAESARTESCLFCRWYSVCHGGCPSDYRPGSEDAHHFCAEYQRIFAHIEERLESAEARAAEGLSDDNLAHIVNPRLKTYLLARRAEREARQENAS